MALINCPYCASKISDRAVSCPHCRCQFAPVSTVYIAGIMEDSSYFSGSIFDFGIKNCFKAETDNFWMRGSGESVYITKTHGVRSTGRIAKTKGQITGTWALGLLGILGLHYFPVGRFITGTLRLLYGALMLVIGIAVTYSYRAAQDVDPLRIMLVFLAAALIPSLIDLILILSGSFRDVFRNYIK